MTSDPTSLFRRAVDCHRQGQLGAADQLYRQVLAAVPDHADSWHLLGVVAHQVGAHADAIELISRAIALKSGDASYFANRGEARRALGRIDQAVSDFEKALQLSPSMATARVNLALALRTADKLDEAERSLQPVLARDPAHGEALNALGLVRLDQSRDNEAEVLFARAVAANPRFADAHGNLGTLYQKRGDWVAAERAYRAALTANPNIAVGHFNLGIVLSEQERHADALAAFERAAEINPAYAEAHHNIAQTAQPFRPLEACIAHERRALELKPAYAEAHVAVGNMLMLAGDYAQGWDESEWRWRTDAFRDRQRPFHWPRWRGENLRGGELLVWSEQGLGDEIMAASMIPDILARAPSLAWEVDARLIPLLTRSFPQVEFVPRTADGRELAASSSIAAQIPSASLGGILRRTAAGFSPARPYLVADQHRRNELRERLRGSDGAPLIGISWISKNAEFGRFKSTRLADWMPLLRLPGFRFVDLQYGDTSDERRALAAAGATLHHVEGLDLRDDIDGVAALVAACDMVVTVSNTTAHLAGALGVPTWVIVPVSIGKFWYWAAGNGSLWYPRVRVFRQSQNGDWGALFAGLCGALTSAFAPLSDVSRPS